MQDKGSSCSNPLLLVNNNGDYYLRLWMKYDSKEYNEAFTGDHMKINSNIELSEKLLLISDHPKNDSQHTTDFANYQSQIKHDRLNSLSLSNQKSVYKITGYKMARDKAREKI